MFRSNSLHTSSRQLDGSHQMSKPRKLKPGFRLEAFLLISVFATAKERGATLYESLLRRLFISADWRTSPVKEQLLLSIILMLCTGMFLINTGVSQRNVYLILFSLFIGFVLYL